MVRFRRTRLPVLVLSPERKARVESEKFKVERQDQNQNLEPGFSLVQDHGDFEWFSQNHPTSAPHALRGMTP
jgi:hypothetical protein